MNRLRTAPLSTLRLPLSTLRRTRHHHPRPTPQILVSSTSTFTMAPPKAALDFVDFVNASPTRM